MTRQHVRQMIAACGRIHGARRKAAGITLMKMAVTTPICHANGILEMPWDGVKI